MRSSLVVKASDCQCTNCNGPGFDPSIRRHSGIWGTADEAVLNIVRKKKIKKIRKRWKPVEVMGTSGRITWCLWMVRMGSQSRQSSWTSRWGKCSSVEGGLVMHEYVLKAQIRKKDCLFPQQQHINIFTCLKQNGFYSRFIIWGYRDLQLVWVERER